MLLHLFPNFYRLGSVIASPGDVRYNCIAWAAGETHRVWWPGLWYWPPGVPIGDDLAAFVQAFATLGYMPCPDDSLEPGFEKVAIYAVGAAVKPMARQLPGGRWTSKLGPKVDVEHVLGGLVGPTYGTVVQILKRPSKAITLPVSPP
jgi:hypothetical protein